MGAVPVVSGASVPDAVSVVSAPPDEAVVSDGSFVQEASAKAVMTAIIKAKILLIFIKQSLRIMPAPASTLAAANAIKPKNVDFLYLSYMEMIAQNIHCVNSCISQKSFGDFVEKHKNRKRYFRAA